MVTIVEYNWWWHIHDWNVATNITTITNIIYSWWLRINGIRTTARLRINGSTTRLRVIVFTYGRNDSNDSENNYQTASKNYGAHQKILLRQEMQINAQYFQTVMTV